MTSHMLHLNFFQKLMIRLKAKDLISATKKTKVKTGLTQFFYELVKFLFEIVKLKK